MRKRTLVFALAVALSAPFLAQADVQADFEQGLRLYLADRLPEAMMTLDGPANQGHAEAQMLLAYILDKAEENAAAVAWYRRASDGGALKAHFHLGIMLVAGEGVEQDRPQGIGLIQKAADGGYPEAMSWLGSAYRSGLHGLPKDPDKAATWLERAEKTAKTREE